MTDIMEKKLSHSVPNNNNRMDKQNDFETNVTLANTNIEKGHWDTAYSYLKAAVEMNPNYAEGYNHLGIFYTRNKKYTDAINNFKRALQINFALNDAHYNLASVYMERKEFTMALSHFKEVVLAVPADYETYYLMGSCCLSCHKESEAESFFSESHRLKPDYVPAAISLCKLLIKKEDYAMAKNTLLYVLKNDASVPEVHFLLGVIYKIQQKYPKAMHHFREALLKDKNNTEAYNLLGECCIELGLDKQAEAFFVMAIKLDMSHLNAFLNLGNLYYKQQRYNDVLLYLEECVKTRDASDSINAIWSDTTHTNNEEMIPIYNLVGHCYKRTDYPMKAQVVWEKSLAIKSQQQDIKEELSHLPQTAHAHKRVSLVID